MKKTQVKKTLKPIIRECLEEILFEEDVLSEIIKEMMFRDGVLARVISEVNQAKPIMVMESQQARQSQQTIRESARPSAEDFVDRAEREAELAKALHERKIRLQRAAGLTNVFEGTAPLARGGSESDSSPAAQAKMGPMAGIDPTDAGIDLSRLGFRGKG